MADRILEKTIHERPANAPHWSVRGLAAELGVSPSIVYRVWKAHGIRSPAAELRCPC